MPPRMDLDDKGQFFSPAFTAQLAADTKGTVYEKDAAALVEQQKVTTGFASAPARKQIRGAFSNPEAEAQYIQAALEITAAKYVQSGSADIPEAVRLATGGIVERNGQKIPLPYGMSTRRPSTSASPA
jgi:hypothetical protein